ncbi:hypothetical protein BSL82_01305 [Tardibacter chloracetimidivorans]|uniref:Bacteriophage tail tape measure N-terminal domain-containing protein n=1 Tax=Tardibacter chloracetimidivorans TaxID=1921510 RepID=A0A1L3ZR47_9SPHN|nr:phage tail length tape measure family protein [Tardibacter chloracetimidivorans]API58101.1 hypothetical protein BSL82_01305 [Tardibacter chloracetimidivorans]
MTDLASLALRIDSTEVASGAASLDKLTAAGTRAEGAVDRLGDSTAQAGRQIRTGSQAAADFAASAQRQAEQIRRFGSASLDMGKNTGLAAHHVQNLAFQFQDVAQGLLTGQRPLTVFLQQGAQIGGIMQQASLGVGGLTRALLGMAGAAAAAVLTNPVLLALAAAAGTAYGAFKLFQSSIDDSGVLTDYANSLGLTAKEMKELENVTVTAGDVFKGLWKTIDDGLGLSTVFSSIKEWAVDAFTTWLDFNKTLWSSVYGLAVGSFEAVKNVWNRFPAIMGDLFAQAANKAIDGMNWMIEKAIAGINTLASRANALIGQDIFGQLGEFRIDNIANPNQGMAARTIADNMAAVAARTREARGAMDSFTDSLGKNVIAAAKTRISAQAAEILADRTEKAAKAAKEAADRHREFEQAMAGVLREIRQAQSEFEALQDKYDPLTASARRYREELDKISRAVGNKLLSDADAEVWKRKALIDSVANDIDSLSKEAAAEMGFGLKNAAKNAKEELLDGVRGIVNALDQLGDAGRTLADIGAVLEGFAGGDFSGARGPLGGLFALIGKAGGKDTFKPLTDKLDDIFGGENGQFAKTMKDLLGGAGIGLASGMIANGGQNSALGSSIGGALGQTLGKELLGPMMGKLGGAIAGPLGSIAGGIIGGAIGGAFKKTKWGRVDLTAGGYDVAGNSGKAKANAVTAGDSFTEGLAGIAEQFGGTVGDFGRISLGQRHGDWRVNAGGTSLKIKKGAVEFDEDAEGAVAYAMKLAIERGAIQGIRNSTNALLRAGSDIQVQLQKALQFEGVFSDLKARLDPTGAALDDLTKRFDGLRTIFKEAGATTAEYAQLEQLLALQRKDILDQAAAEALDKLNERRALEVRLLEAQGNATAAAALARQIELSQTKDELKDLMRRVHAAEVAAEAQEKAAAALEEVRSRFRAFTDDLIAFRDELSGASSGTLTYRQAMVKLMTTGGLAAAGDETALGSLSGIGRDFLSLAKDRASSAAQYARDIAMVREYVDKAIAVSQGVSGITSATVGGVGAIAAPSLVSAGQTNADLLAEVKAMRSELKALMLQEVSNSGGIKRVLDRADGGDYLRIGNDSDTPVYTEAAP